MRAWALEVEEKKIFLVLPVQFVRLRDRARMGKLFSSTENM